MSLLLKNHHCSFGDPLQGIVHSTVFICKYSVGVLQSSQQFLCYLNCISPYQRQLELTIFFYCMRAWQLTSPCFCSLAVKQRSAMTQVNGFHLLDHLFTLRLSRVSTTVSIVFRENGVKYLSNSVGSDGRNSR